MLSMVLLSAGAAAQPLVPRTPLSVSTVRAPLLQAPHEHLLLTVKFTDGARARVNDRGQVVLTGDARPEDAAALQALSAAWGLSFRPRISLPGGTLGALEDRAAAHSGRAQPDLGGIMAVTLAGDAGELEAAGEALKTLAVVERANITVAFPAPPADITPTTPDYTAQQDYIGGTIGVDAEYAWALGFDGDGVRVADCEYGWNPDHEEFEDLGVYVEAGQTIPSIIYDYGYDSHGTAVWGEIGAHDGKYGVTGAAHGVQLAGYIEYSNEEGSRRPESIAQAIADSDVGDIVLLEMQVTGAGGGYGPAELDPDVWDVVRVGADAGVVIVAAAGNGSQNLDLSTYDDYTDWGDSGAIIVGAGSADSSHDRLYFSTYGSRVDVQGFGESVFTTGYGGYAEHGGDKNQRYTSTFGGTSSASPIVTSAAALLQQVAVTLSGVPLSSEEMRTLLIETGTPQGSGGEIGPLPDVGAGILALADDNPIQVSIDPLPDFAEGDLPTLSASVDGADVGLELAWAVGDGTDADPFPDDGTYTVVVTASDDLGRTATDSAEVSVSNVAPTLEVALDATASEGEAVAASAVTEDVAGDTVTVSWIVDGEAAATGSEAALEFADDGEYAILVVAADEDGGETSWTGTVSVSNADPVIASIDADVGRAGESTALAVSASDPGDDTLSVAWDFGDGSTGEGDTAEHTYDAAGSYTVTATVTDEDGGSASASEEISVSAAPKEEPGSCSAAPSAPRMGWALLGLVAVALRRRR